MGKKDVLTNRFMKKPRIFADFFNGYLYEGKEVIKPELLKAVDTSSIANIPYYKGSKSMAIQKYRDIIKKAIVMKSDNAYLVLCGIENQTDIHYAMPVRNMLYNALSYYEQVEKIAAYNRENGKCVANNFLSGYTKDDKLMLVITVTLYWGAETWDAPTTLREMLSETDEIISALVDDVDCNLFSIMDVEKLPKYQTELQELFMLLRTRNDSEAMKKLVTTDESYKHINRETAELMKEFANIELPDKNKEGDYNMCKAVMELKQEGQREGEDIKAIELIQNAMNNTAKSFEEVCNMLGITTEDMNRYRKMI